MPDCDKLDQCKFFTSQLSLLPKTAEMLRQKFCHGDPSQCARLQVAHSDLPVPKDLFPNEAPRARRILLDAEAVAGSSRT